MQVIEKVSEMQALVGGDSLKQPIGLVPTMGDLHDGHISLIKHCQKQCATTIATIFVNPLQFGKNEDFDGYPRVMERDIQELTQLNVDVLFAPHIDEMYPDGQTGITRVSVPGISDILCGASRPGHFDGVTTVVSKLFHITQPSFAYFGEKDWQQLTIIRHMVDQLNFPLEIVGVPTSREVDGLARSSRNRYLTQEERQIAPGLYSVLRDIATEVNEGNKKYQDLERAAGEHLKKLGFQPDYIAIRQASDLALPNEGSEHLRIFGAARLGRARLIDNMAIGR